MHLRNLLLAIFIAWSGILNAQDHEKNFQILDSLIKAKEYENALLLVEKANPDKTPPFISARYYRVKADLHYYLYETKESLAASLRAISNLERSGVDKPAILIDLQISVASAYSSLGLHAKAHEYGENALNESTQLNDTSRMAEALAGIATNYVYQGNYEESLKYFEQTFAINQAINDSVSISYDLNDLAFVNNRLGQQEKAIALYQKSLKYIDAEKNSKSYATKLNNIGMTYGELGQYDSALHYVNQSHQMFINNGDSLNAAKRLLNLGVLSQRMGNLSQSEEYLKRAQFVLGDRSDRLNLLLANAKAELLIKKKEFGKADVEIAKAIQISTRIKAYLDLVNAYNLKKQLAVDNRDFKTAYELQDKIQIARDSMASQKSKRVAEQLSVEYDVFQKESEIELLTAQNELAIQKIESKEQQFILLSVIATIVIIGIVAFVFIQRQKFQLKKNLLFQEIDTLRAQLTFTFDGKDLQSIPMQKINEGLFRPLSEREYEILRHALTEKTNSEIAETVFLSVNTVKYHLKNVYDKLGVSNRKEALQVILKQA